MSQTETPVLRPARREDVPLIIELIGGLAKFERLSDQVRVSRTCSRSICSARARMRSA